MKLATWNVNSLNVRLPHVLDWLAQHEPDVLCLQETKVPDEAFPLAALREAGWTATYSGQKTYNGVAIVSRVEGTDIATGIPDFEDEQKRVISGRWSGVQVVCAYFPNGQSVGSDKYAYKLRWLEALRRWLGRESARESRIALLGDYNIAPEDRDVHDPEAWRGNVLVSEPERAAFRGLLDLGFKDSFRLFEQEGNGFTWWDYRMNAFRRNLGLRIDHILLGPGLAGSCTSCQVDKAPRKLERPSDHAPVIAEVTV